MSSTVEVLPDVSGLDRTFAYEVPEELAGAVTPGCIVRVVLHGRRVRGWVVAESGELPPGLELRPLSDVVSLGPSPEVVDLSRWAAWLYAGRLRPLLLAASPPRFVRALPVRPPRAGKPATPAPPPRAGKPHTSAPTAKAKAPLEDEIATATAQALSCPSAVLRLPPAAPRLAVIAAALRAVGGQKDLLVLAASRHDALIVASRLERAGYPVALQPDAWAGAAAGGRVVVGTRSAVLAPVAGLGAIVVLDAHVDSYQEERVPTWEAAVLAEERARRAGAPCLLVSACPTVDMVSGRPLFTLSRESERAGWAPIEVLDARDEDPRAGGYPARLAAVIREAVSAEPQRPVVAVLNRKGRARLLACRRCRSLLRCEVCGGALVQLERQAAGEVALLHCPRCSLDVPAQCAACGPTRPVIVRPGVARAREDLAALTGLEVAEIGRLGAAPDGLAEAPVLIGTEAVLHRAALASVVVFLDFDNELLAPRYRAGEQALALLALASRLVGGRRRSGRVVARTRSPDHEVLDAALHADPGRLVAVEQPRRVQLRLPPATALALVSGDGAAELVSRLSPVPGSLEVGSAAAGRFLIRAAGPEELAEALAAAGPAPAGTRVEVAPRQV
jgi:primosomal protein N' (replication factor Y)